MKAPDKIYVTIDRPAEKVLYNPELVGVAWSKKDKSCEHIEYIRKDALMEWLEGKMTVEGATEGFVGGYDFALKDVINKLNSM